MNPHIEFIEMDQIKSNSVHMYEQVTGEPDLPSDEPKRVKKRDTWSILLQPIFKIALIASAIVTILVLGWFFKSSTTSAGKYDNATESISLRTLAHSIESLDTLIKDQKRDLNENKKYQKEANEKINNQNHRIDEANRKISDQKREMDETKKSLEEANEQIMAQKKDLNNLKQNVVPVGFVYAQLPNEKSPAEIWPGMKWTDVSTTYAGVFFRVIGGDAAALGQVQADNVPRLNEIFFSPYKSTKTGKYTNTWMTGITVPRTGWSDGIYAGKGGGDAKGESSYLQFKLSTGEVRPRNMAITIWKRTN